MRMILLLLLLALPAQAQSPNTVLLTGRAQTGTDTREVQFEFLCTSNAGPTITGALSLELFIPRHDQLSPVFDFNPFEGPDARAGQKTQIDTTAGEVTATARFGVSGWIGVTADQPFVFGLAAARRGNTARLAAIGRVLQPLTTGAGRLVWTQENTRRGRPAIVATLEVSEADSNRLRAVLRPCLGS